LEGNTLKGKLIAESNSIYMIRKLTLYRK